MKLKAPASTISTLEGKIDTLRAEVNEIRVEVKEVRSDMTKTKDGILNRLDEVMGILETLRDENVIGAYQTRELHDEVDGHEKRITKLEKSAA